MKEFLSFGDFALHLARQEITALVEVEKALDRVAKHVQDAAKAELGAYQPQKIDYETGEFSNEWDSLAESTKADRLKKGFTPDDPLLRTGQLRDSIERETQHFEAAIGVKDGPHVDYETGEIKNVGDIAVRMEYGYQWVPPRPFMGPASFNIGARIDHELGNALVRGIAGFYPIPPR